MRIPLIQALHMLRLPVDNHTRNAPQLPTPTNPIRRATRLVAETHIVGVLVVERHPLRFAVAFDAGEGDFAVVADDAGEDHLVAAERGFLFESAAGHSGILAVVGFALDGLDFAGFDI